jgi:hypothetical protein
MHEILVDCGEFLCKSRVESFNNLFISFHDWFSFVMVLILAASSSLPHMLEFAWLRVLFIVLMPSRELTGHDVRLFQGPHGIC